MPFRLNLCFVSSLLMNASGSLTANARPSTWMATHLQVSPLVLIQMLSSTRLGWNPSICMTSENLLWHLWSLEQSPWGALSTTNQWPFSDPNLGPTGMLTFSVVLASRWILEMSVLDMGVSFNSTRNLQRQKSWDETTPEWILSTGMSVKCPTAAILTQCLPSCLTWKTRWTLIFLKPSSSGDWFPWPENYFWEKRHSISLRLFNTSAHSHKFWAIGCYFNSDLFLRMSVNGCLIHKMQASWHLMSGQCIKAKVCVNIMGELDLLSQGFWCIV